MLKFKVFSSITASWEILLQEAASFASSIGRERFVSIPHTADKYEGVGTVWYWDEAG